MTEAQESNRQERKAIMETEGATPEEVEACYKAFPQLYGLDDREQTQTDLF